MCFLSRKWCACKLTWTYAEESCNQASFTENNKDSDYIH